MILIAHEHKRVQLHLIEPQRSPERPENQPIQFLRRPQEQARLNRPYRHLDDLSSSDVSQRSPHYAHTKSRVDLRLSRLHT